MPEVPPIQPERFWERAGHSVRLRAVPRGREPGQEPPTGRIMMGGGHRPGRYLDDDAPMRAFSITWTSDEGPAGAVAREGGQEIPLSEGRIRLNDPDDPRPVRKRPGVRYDDSVEVMPYHLLDRAYDEMAALGVDPTRIAAMRLGRPVPPPGPDEPLAQVTIVFVPPRLRSYLPHALSEQDEWRRRNRLPRLGRVGPLHDFLLHRHAELAAALREDALPPVLLAMPTWTSGHLDPDVLVGRLETCAAAGVEPLPADLAQALLRLPRGRHPAAAERAAKVESEAARSAARWLAGDGMADPECGHGWRHMVDASMVEFGDAEPEPFAEVRLRPVLRVTAPTGNRLIDEVALREPSEWAGSESRHTMGAWPAVLPSHREVVAVSFLPYLLQGHWGDWRAPAEITGLELAQGPMGESGALILAFLLASGVPEMIPLALRMAARGELPAEAIGRQLALALRRTWLETTRAIAALTGLAEAGGHHEVWRVMRALLPVMLPGEGRRVTVSHTRLVAFATDVALWTGARGDIPVVAERAGSRRTTRFAHACRRLHAQLTGATS
ncbi:hypothetical protein [Nonomuraea sp. NPDC049684]|uniref:hypothetical protein n=1 Tax=Nonomuraea sp. NPDC049684 TaxID=3364356 RepID=UPI00378D0495